jgi:Zn-finger nucleic acid-binding protein
MRRPGGRNKVDADARTVAVSTLTSDMLLACPVCHLQYDAGAQEPGSKVRCFCGELITVPEQKARQVKMIHCSHCGGRLAEGATVCEFCSAEVALGDRGLGELCPECFSRMVVDARFCSTCGVPIRPELVLKALKDLECPRCAKCLTLCRSEESTFTECTSCGGVWLEAEMFRQMSSERTRAAAAGTIPSLPLQPPKTPAVESTVRYLKCPVCKDLMVRKNFSGTSGVILDWCRRHGYWFDAHELEAILRFIDEGGVEDARRREHQRNKFELHQKRTTSYVPASFGRSWVGRSSRGWSLTDILFDAASILFNDR